MKFLLSIMALFMSLFINAQTSAFHNYGNIKMHENASVGFHTDFINDGVLDDNNKGLAGFYSDSEIRTVSGNNRAVFENLEFDAINDIELYSSLGTTGEMSFINGKVFTPRNEPNVSLDYINHQFYIGEDDSRHVDGYSSVFGTNEFVFPIGDDNRLRPMILPSQTNNNEYSGAYYFYNPNTPPTHFSESFSTSQKQIFISNISNLEFWDLDGASETKITLTWDPKSDINAISNNINLLRVVGWSKTESKWIDLGRTSSSGDLNSGRIMSNSFIPDEYTIITIGSEFAAGELADINLIFTPNGDSENETLTFEGLEQYKNNNLSIFNRWGNVVYETENYKNDWKGKSNGRVTVNKDQDLPDGTYFYLLKLGSDESKSQKGWIYIHR
ncbi:gliding motility-associated C-terminal domain-containing protein [uncultured Tenacibaculum sp.]|uniref:gliding motility-associated C-terminal domain-containing protein n=1 Tax=uncultured Tenacibaculum sp. TaxID=174713 RepID=UPI00262CEA99|nr:gliding motility-associated C-terminal domain-containing protein [uncultured Tenacibaculum sp.]